MKKIAYDLKWPLYSAIPNAVNAIRSGAMLFLSGCSSVDANGNLVAPGDIESQTRHTMENLRTALVAAGASFENVVHMDTFYSGSLDLESIHRSVKVRSSYFSKDNPYTTTGVIVVGFTVPGLLVEIDAIAVVD